MLSHSQRPLLDALDTITGTGVFCATGAAPFFLPELQVAGVGEVAFPLTRSQTRELIAVAEAAPYGKGLATVRDDKVRRCWQLDARQFSLQSVAWQRYLQETVDAAAAVMGVEGEVAAEPYKLLLYEKGGHFLPHRDTEKLSAMFGTLIIALPSAHKGGRLRVRHGGEEAIVDFSTAEGMRQFQGAAFFADCEHEVEPVTEGVRCCLVYNLVLKKGNSAALNRTLDEHTRRLLPVLKGLTWPGPGKPAAVLLEHHYTEANFSLHHLKGHDAARARSILAAAAEADMVAYLALVTFHQLGELRGAYDDYYRSSRRSYRYSRDEPGKKGDEMGEVFEESLTASHWRDGADRPVTRDSMPLEMESLISRRPINEGAPHEKEAEGYTGNAGCTMDYWYRRAAVVLWPRQQHEAVLVSTNFRAACQELASLARRKEDAGRPEFQRLLAAVLAALPERLPEFSPWRVQLEGATRQGREVEKDPFSLTVGAIAHANERPALDTLLGTVKPEAFACLDGDLWKNLMRAFGAAPFADISTALRADPAMKYRTPLFLMLDAATACGESAAAAELARHLAALPPHPATPSRRDNDDESAPGSEPELLIMLRASSCLTTAGDKARVLAFLEAGGSLAAVRQHLAPALIRWAAGKQKIIPGSPPAAALAYAIDRLSEEIARPILPWPDFTRPCPAPQQLSPYSWDRETGPLLAELRAFMADPAAATHVFARREAERATIENFISRHRLDLDTTTIRKCSPHQLHCTKNSASHERALRQREADISMLRELEAISATMRA